MFLLMLGPPAKICPPPSPFFHAHAYPPSLYAPQKQLGQCKVLSCTLQTLEHEYIFKFQVLFFLKAPKHCMSIGNWALYMKKTAILIQHINKSKSYFDCTMQAASEGLWAFKMDGWMFRETYY